MALSISEQITYSTIRIEALNAAGQCISTGTGFVFNLSDNDQQTIPILITNKHVISNAALFKLVFCISENDIPCDTKHHNVVFSVGELPWTMHPEDDVDLAAIPLAPIYYQASQKGIKIFYKSINSGIIPKDADKERIDAVEMITMVGYPIGLWDQINNKPLVRRGVTATHFNFDYCGKKEFLIDCACFPGSSGSPVFILNVGSHINKNGALSSGDRLFFLGVLYAGPQFNAHGDIKVVDIPTAQTAFVNSSIPTNIGIVIKSEKILAFKPLFMP